MDALVIAVITNAGVAVPGATVVWYNSANDEEVGRAVTDDSGVADTWITSGIRYATVQADGLGSKRSAEQNCPAPGPTLFTDMTF